MASRPDDTRRGGSTAERPSILTFPNEILLEISGFCDDASQRSLSKSCKFFTEFFLQHIYHAVRFQGSKSAMVLMLRAFTTTRQEYSVSITMKRESIKQASFIIEEPKGPVTRGDWSKAIGQRSTSEEVDHALPTLIFKAINQMTNLRSLELDLKDYLPQETLKKLQHIIRVSNILPCTHIRLNTQSSIAVDVLRKCSSKTLEAVHVYVGPETKTLDVLLKHFKNLKKLSLIFKDGVIAYDFHEEIGVILREIKDLRWLVAHQYKPARPIRISPDQWTTIKHDIIQVISSSNLTHFAFTFYATRHGINLHRTHTVDAVDGEGAAPTPFSPDEIHSWYKAEARDMMGQLPQLDVLCIMREYPTYYKGQRDTQTRELKVDMVDFHISMDEEFPIGLHRA